MADSALVTKWMPAYAGNYTKNRAAQGGRITEITVHHCAGVMTVDSLGALWQRVGRNGSSHYGVCGDAVGQYVAESDVAWTNSNWKANCRAVTIEVSNSGGEPNWPVSAASLETLAKLLADIARRNGLGELYVGKNLTYHSMYSATKCPGPYLKERLADVARRANEINAAEVHEMGKGVQALAQEAITMQIGPASGGDRAALRALAERLAIGYTEDESGRMRIGPASAGDQRAVLAKAAELLLPYGIWEPESTGASEQLAALEEELEEIKKQRDSALAKAEKAVAALEAVKNIVNGAA